MTFVNLTKKPALPTGWAGYKYGEENQIKITIHDATFCVANVTIYITYDAGRSNL